MLQTKPLSQIMTEPDDQGEVEYRRGMSDCVGKLFLAVETLPEQVDRSTLEDSLWRWWHSLLRWQRLPVDTTIEPPEIDWSRP